MADTEIAEGTCGCGWPRAEPGELVSRHFTTEGIVVYTRCVCGALQVRLGRWGEDLTVISESRAGRIA